MHFYSSLFSIYDKFLDFSELLVIKLVMSETITLKLSKLWLYSSRSWNKIMHSMVGNIKQGYRFAAWNCRKGLLLPDNTESLKLDDIQSFLLKYDIHLFGLIECDIKASGFYTCKQDILDNLKINGYNVKLPLSWSIHNQARIIVYVKDDLKVKWKDLRIQDSDLPSISCEIGSGNSRTCVNFFYREWKSRVNGSDDKNSQLERLQRQINHWRTLYSCGADVVIMGDANLCSFKWNEPSYAHKHLADVLQDFLLENSSFQQIKQYTRSEFCRNGLSRSCIDHCYTDVPEKLTQVRVESIGDSDHLGIMVTKLNKYNLSKPQTIRKRCYKNFDIMSFLTDIYYSNINECVPNEQNLESAAKIFEQMFGEILEKHAPMKTLFVRKNYRPEISPETKLLIQEKQLLHKEACRTGNIVLLSEYKNKCKEVKKAVKEDKKIFESKFMTQGSIQHAWRQTKRILKLENNLAPTSVVKHGEVITNPKLMANIFNEFFVEKVKLFREKTSAVPVTGAINRLKRWLETKGRLRPFRLEEINTVTFRQLLKKFKSKRSCGVDQIDSYSLKISAPLIEDALIHLINLSIRNCQFANTWKPQLIFPLHKKEDRTKAENYRPVSHLVELGKMVEYAVFQQVMHHFRSNDLFHSNLHGSLSDHSTSTALLQIMDHLYQAAENSEMSAVLLIDQSAAYDLLDHKIFLEKLKAYNFDNDSIAWFESYLSGRTQIVQVESKFSEVQSVGCHGAPQGSILAGLIFLIYSNDFPASSTEGESIVYVDDNTDIVSGSHIDILQSKAQAKADSSASWLKENRMCVAGSKSKLLLVGTRHQRIVAHQQMGLLTVKIDDKIITETASEKLLGLTLNNRFTWNEYLYGENSPTQGQKTSGLLSQLSRRIGMLRMLSKRVPKTRLKIFADGLFYSKLHYCLPVFGNVFGLDTYNVQGQRFTAYTKEDNRKLQVLQNSVMRLLTGCEKRTPTAVLLEKTKSLSVHQTIAFQTLVLTRKILNSSKPTYLATKLRSQMELINVLRSQEGNVIIPRYQLNSSRAGFLYRAAKLFNSLPTEIKLEENISKFKCDARAWIIMKIAIKP